MQYCMFHPVGHPLERGWVGRVDGDRVVHLAAQTIQSFFSGGGAAREHAEYLLAEVHLLAPVLHPPSIRVFANQSAFTFANPAAIVGPGATIMARRDPSDTVSQGHLALVPRIAGVIGAGGEIGGYTGFVEWRDPALEPPKDRDFALGLGPVVVTPDEFDDASSEFDWDAAVELASAGTVLYPGDILASPPGEPLQGIQAEADITVEIAGIGTLDQRIGG